MRRRAWYSLALLGTLIALPVRAAPSWRVTYGHGSACQTNDPVVQPALYQDTGIQIKVTSSGQAASLSCPLSWSQDLNANTLQKLIVTLDWNSVPVSVGAGSFSPTCTFYVLSLALGEVAYGLTQINNAGTANPEYVFVALPTAVFPLPAWGLVLGSGVYCTGVPQGVGVLGYSVQSCIAGATGGC